MGAAFEKIKRRVSDRNFNNDIVNILKNLKRYKLEDKPIDVGNSTFDGAMLEFTIAIVEELDIMAEQIVELKKTVAVLSAQSVKECECKNVKEQEEAPAETAVEEEFIEEAVVEAEPVKEPEKPKAEKPKAEKKGGAK